MEVMETLLTYIANNGFAIIVALYMIVINTRTVEANTAATKELVTLIKGMTHHE